jgi:hypothetical protein
MSGLTAVPPVQHNEDMVPTPSRLRDLGSQLKHWSYRHIFPWLVGIQTQIVTEDTDMGVMVSTGLRTYETLEFCIFSLYSF